MYKICDSIIELDINKSVREEKNMYVMKRKKVKNKWKIIGNS